MSIRGLLRRVAVPAVLTGAAITTAAVYSGWVDSKFMMANTMSSVLLFTDPETAHGWALWAAEKGLLPSDRREDPPVLRTQIWGRIYPNPIGLAAGFDKDARGMEAMLGMGLGFVEIGSVTPLPQEGNPKPRVFRIPEQRAVINRYGFNSEGLDVAARRLSEFRESHPAARLGVNLGVNKTNALDWKAAARDYSLGVSKLGGFADYIVVNVSSPNTLGLRTLQSRKQFATLIIQVKRVRDEMNWGKRGPPPLFVKISPDLTKRDREDIARIALDGGFDGLIVSNTTVARQGVEKSVVAAESGGLSGAPLFEPSTALLREMYILTKGSIPIIGCGGVSNGKQAYEKIRAGASLVQLYTALVYEGPAMIPKVKAELIQCLKEDNYDGVWQAVGAEHKQSRTKT